MLYNVVLVYAVQQHESDTHTHTPRPLPLSLPLPPIPAVPYRSFPLVIYFIHGICQGYSRNLPHPFLYPTVSMSSVSASTSLFLPFFSTIFLDYIYMHQHRILGRATFASSISQPTRWREETCVRLRNLSEIGPDARA